VECLRRVDAGQRFACVEYSLVLAQALNALGIPARKLSLRQQNYHVGLGRGHVVSEAWIDDLCRWVVLDGQNGMYWTGDDGKPLGAPELQRAAQSGVVFQRDRLVLSNRLEHQPDVLYPDLSQIGVQTTLDDGRPALRLSAAHPYGRGFVVDGERLPADVLPLDLQPGDHELTLAVLTSYGALPGKRLRYHVAPPTTAQRSSAGQQPPPI
jgi:hypothetical protein